MPANYLNLTSPIKRETNTYVDQDGVKFSSMLITATAACAPALVPDIGSVYELDSNLSVTQSDLTFSGDGLGKIVVTAAGPSLTAKPRVRIIPGAPFIFGLKPPRFNIAQDISLGAIRAHPTAGVTVEVRLIAAQDQIQAINDTYVRKIMPAQINGVYLPEPASGPISLNSSPEPVENIPGGISRVIGAYYGYVCVNIQTETRGTAMLVILSFQESGYAQGLDFLGSAIRYINIFSYNP